MIRLITAPAIMPSLIMGSIDCIDACIDASEVFMAGHRVAKLSAMLALILANRSAGISAKNYGIDQPIAIEEDSDGPS